MLTKNSYVPSVRWRQAEYQALSRLADSAKDCLIPLIQIPSVEYDFEEQRPKKTIDDHVGTFPKRFLKKWGSRPAWLDINEDIASHRMTGDQLPIEFVLSRLDSASTSCIPVTSLAAQPDVRKAIARITKARKQGFGLRIRTEELMLPNFGDLLNSIIEDHGSAEAEIDLLVDLGAPNFDPMSIFADALVANLALIKKLSEFRSAAVIATSYPSRLGVIKPGGVVARKEFEFFRHLRERLTKAGLRVLAFGDYTITHPLVTLLDMRTVKPAGKIVYTSGSNWQVVKGGSFRTDPQQMHQHCRHIVGSGYFRGAQFSDGDAFIESCANEIVTHSNLTKWKEVGISHHIMHVLEDLANLSS